MRLEPGLPMKRLLFLLVLLFPLVPPMPMASDGSTTSRRGSSRMREAIRATDLLSLRTIREVSVDPAGRFAVISIEEFVPGDEVGETLRPGDHEIRKHLHLVDLRDPDAPPIQLTFGARRDGSPRVSPDGTRLAFVRSVEEEDDEGKKRSQVWLLPLEGGGEARLLTDLEHGASSPCWSPDGRQLLVETRIPLTELVESDGPTGWDAGRIGRPPTGSASGRDVEGAPDGSIDEVRAWLDRNSDDRTPRLIESLDFLGEREVEEQRRLRQLVLVGVDVAAEPRRLGRGAVDRRDAAFTMDGSAVVMVVAGGDRAPDRVVDSRLEIVDLDRPESSRSLFDAEGWRVSDPQPGPDGSLIAFRAQQTDEPGYRGHRIGLVPTAGGEPIWATDGEWQSVDRFRWGHEPATVLFTARHEGAISFHTASPATLQPVAHERWREGLPLQVHDFDLAEGRTVWIESSAGAPSVLRMKDESGERLLLDPNPWIASRRIVRPVEGWVERPDGHRVQYWIMEPAGAETGGRRPLMLSIHGGPMSMWGPADPTMWFEWQLASAWGYGIVYANPRGSSGYGEAFQRANHQNWGAGPAGDCLAALDEACTRDWVDTDRLVVTGGSYGGYLTAWIIAHDHRFKAAVAQRGVYDLVTFFGEGNAYELVERAFGGHPPDPRFAELLDRQSPVRHARDIRTPLLILHGEKDRRTGVSQSGMLFRSIKIQGLPVEYVLYPDGDHDLSRTSDPTTRLDRLLRILEFFSRYASPDPSETDAGPTPGEVVEASDPGI